MTKKKHFTYSMPDRWFEDWWEPKLLFKSVEEFKQPIETVELFNNPSLKPVLEAWAAARFAAILSQDRFVRLRLEKDRFPDFQLTVRNELMHFELIEADHEGRLRGKEYKDKAEKEAEGTPLETEEFDPNEEERDAIPAILRSIKKKAEKRYSPPPHLLVYVNFFLFDEPPITEIQARQMASEWGESFASAWLLWGSFIIRLWPSPPAKIRDQTGLPL